MKMKILLIIRKKFENMRKKKEARERALDDLIFEHIKFRQSLKKCKH
jgi:hypothetical protein